MAATSWARVAGGSKASATVADGMSTSARTTPGTALVAHSMEVLQCRQWISGTERVISVIGTTLLIVVSGPTAAAGASHPGGLRLGTGGLYSRGRGPQGVSPGTRHLRECPAP